MIRRLFAAIRRWYRNLSHPEFVVAITQAQRLERVLQAADLREQTAGGSVARVDFVLWGNEMTRHLALLDDGIELMVWGADA